MLSYLEGHTSEQETREIQAYISRYPYYQDILNGLQDLKTTRSNQEIAKHLQQQKSAARKQLFGTKEIPA